MQLTPCNSPTLAFHFQAQMSNGTICTTMQFVAYNYASAFYCLNQHNRNRPDGQQALRCGAVA